VVNFALTYHQDRIGRRRAALTTESAGQPSPMKVDHRRLPAAGCPAFPSCVSLRFFASS
jgi:hypothetical protein